jgi:hypothetical protein
MLYVSLIVCGITFLILFEVYRQVNRKWGENP